MKCESCGQAFDIEFVADEFELEFLLNYNNLAKKLCLDCAIEAINDRDIGIYFEDCESCGKRFDLFEEESIFESNFPWYNGTTLRDHWDDEILCAECALADIRK